MPQAEPVPDNKSKVKSQKYNLDLSKKVTVGRSRSCDITINKPEVSSEHAFIYFESEKFWVKDNDSANGTRVNGLPIEGTRELNLNDVIRVGDYTFALVCEFSHSKGKHHYLEIRKLMQRASVSPDFRDKPLNSSVPEKAESESKTKKSESESDKPLNPSVPEKAESESKTKKSVQKDSLVARKKKPKKKRAARKKPSARLQKIGADVVLRLQRMQQENPSLFKRMKEIAVVSILLHFVFAYVLSKFAIFGDDQRKEIREIVMTLQEEEPVLEMPAIPEVEQVEPQLQEASMEGINVNLETSVQFASTSELISDATDNLNFETELSESGGEGVGDIVIGRGQKGVRNGAFMKRVLGAKGRYGDVDIRITLIWDNKSDLDLNLITPEGELYHGRKEVGGGVLDIDKNAPSTDLVNRPVENMIWQKADDGDYDASVIFFTRRSRGKVPFAVELEIFGDVYHYKGALTEENLNVAGKDKREIAMKIVSFSVKDGKYLIRSSMNDRPVKAMKDLELDLVVP